jgi:hypothetical protein
MKFRGNLKQKKGGASGSGMPHGPHDQEYEKGGEVEMRDDKLRAPKLEDVKYDKGGGKNQVGKFKGKAMTGRGGRGGRKKWTAADCAAILGKRRG